MKRKRSRLPAEAVKRIETSMDLLLEVQVNWELLDVLFGRGPDQVASLNSAAPGFFALVQRAISDRVLLDLAKLLDPARTGRRENLVLERILEDVSPHSSKRLRARLVALLSRTRSQAPNLRQVRHARLAHFDLHASIAGQLPKVLVREIVRTLALAKKFMNLVCAEFLGYLRAYEGVPITGGAESLLHALGITRSTRHLPTRRS